MNTFTPSIHPFLPLYPYRCRLTVTLKPSHVIHVEFHKGSVLDRVCFHSGGETAEWWAKRNTVHERHSPKALTIRGFFPKQLLRFSLHHEWMNDITNRAICNSGQNEKHFWFILNQQYLNSIFQLGWVYKNHIYC